MIHRLSKRAFQTRIKALFSSSAAIAATLQKIHARKSTQSIFATATNESSGDNGNADEPTVPFPDELKDFLAQLQILTPVPSNYLIPDAKMLPEESIRFFYYDQNWIDALLDGAYSIGRSPAQDDEYHLEGSPTNLYQSDQETEKWINDRTKSLKGEKLSARLSKARGSASMRFDHATFSLIRNQIDAHTQQIRRSYLGKTTLAETNTYSSSEEDSNIISGFLLRSQIVEQYPLLGMYAYEAGKTPMVNGQDNDNIELMTVLYSKVLPDQPDTLLCILKGDVAQVDLTEPVEQLHFGIGDGTDRNVKVLKNYETATIQNADGTSVDEITLLDPKIPENSPRIDLSDCFRSTDQRTINISKLSGKIGVALGVEMDSAVLGFQMTQGVGSVEFDKT